MKIPKWLFILFLLLLVNSAYIWAYATASIFYMANVLAHVFGGVVVLLLCRKYLPPVSRILFVLAILCAAFLILRGSLIEYRVILYSHIAMAFAAALYFAYRVERRLFIGLALLAIWPAAVRLYPDPNATIKNPLVVPASMEEEGGGPNSPFWPSSAKTDVGGTIPSNFFMDSKLCGECHKDIYEQWNSSMHHFASFNNQFYRKSIEQMQELSGTKGSKWCAGCHDHAVFFNGRFDKPIKDQIDTPEAQNGLGCMSCHSIVHVEGSMGNGGFTIEYPPLHDLASSRNRYIRLIDTFLTYLNPEPHRRAFLKPFMKSSSEFCSTCHKVHLDVPVNNYRWIRGFNDYDNWQASGVSGQGARSFYYPAKSSTCSDCHMPLTDSSDPGHRDGKIHNHRFPAANMAVAYANRDEEQMKATEKFLKSGFITVDIFAATPVQSNGPLEMKRRAGDSQQIMSTFAVGEEAEQSGQVLLREVGKVSAPIDRAQTSVKPGDAVRVDVVVRTRKIGHFFPGGTVDSFDIWLELEARDYTGRLIYHSGAVGDNGYGPVEKGAHFYRSYALDGAGNMIDKRNAWQARSVLYVRLIPPGAADVAHYRVRVPKDAKGPITLRARLNFRKFSHFYTQYVYAGQPATGTAALDHDSREYTFLKSNIPKNVSGKIKGEIPDIPILILAEATSKLAFGEGTKWDPIVSKPDRERWNDWGIGLLLQGDLKAAEYAFKKVTEAEPEYADGWLNVARALIQEGEIEAAKPYLEKAMKLNPSLGRVYFFLAMTQKADGDYDAAIASLRRVESMYPRDRVVLNQIGRVLFLQRKYAEAVGMLLRVLSVDPEDIQAHYTLMLCYRGLEKPEQAAREEKLFRRFKSDESSQSITQKPRMLNPEDNNERQTIHDHESVVLK